MENYEKLGVFYLGRVQDTDKNKTTDELVLYDSKDLTTHAVCVGMTGSGKTGLCISLLEEAALDNIPALIIDPKGDMTNLLLNFPNLSAEDFRPWINENEAQKKNLTPEEFATNQASMWKSGLESWAQSGERLQRLKDAADFNIFTPGSTAGIPVSIMKSFSAPPKDLMDDEDAFNDRITTTTTSLLGLMGIEADPLKSREHILLSTIFHYFWQKGEDLDLSNLIQSVQSPPVDKIGVLNLENFYPPKERFELAMSLNNLLAAPTFQTWLEGVPLDINQLLYTDTGKPRMSIFYIAHLSDAERMFFVSLLLNQIVGWMRMQPGTSSLRAILYIDELFGYMPPVANPPAKKPLLTLLKQARAFGVGVVLATQNPVDLDYKGLSNAGTWFIGRLQTERDRERILDGLSTASNTGKFNRKSMENMISRLGNRIFLLHNVHEDAPVIFQTRWAMSYLSGPLTRSQIKQLMSEKVNTDTQSIGKVAPARKILTPSKVQDQPPVMPGISALYVPARSHKPEGAKLLYRPYLWGSAKIAFINNAKGIDTQKDVSYLVSFEDTPVPIDWENAVAVDFNESALLKTEEESSQYDTVPSAAAKPASYSKWEDDFKNFLFRTGKLQLFKSPSTNEMSKPNENERDFRIRLSQVSREQRDEWTEKLRVKYDKQIAALEEKIRKAQDRVEIEAEQSKQQKLQTAVSIGATVLGAFLGRKSLSRSTISRAGTTISRAGRTMKEASDVQRARENVEIYQQQLKALEDQFQEEVDAQTQKFDIQAEDLETVAIYPQKSNIIIQLLQFVWVPHWQLQGEIPKLA